MVWTGEGETPEVAEDCARCMPRSDNGQVGKDWGREVPKRYTGGGRKKLDGFNKTFGHFTSRVFFGRLMVPEGAKNRHEGNCLRFGASVELSDVA